MTTVTETSMPQEGFQGIYRYRSGGNPFTLWSPDGSGSKLLSSEYNFKQWRRTPGFARLNRKHLPNNDYTREHHTWDARLITRMVNFYHANGENYWETQFRRSSEFYVIVGPNRTVDDLSFDYPEVNRAIADLQQNVSTSSGSLAVSGAEMHKTIEMIGSTAMKLVRAFKALRTGRFGRFCDELGITKSRKTTAFGKKFSKDFKLAKTLDRENRSYGSNLTDLAASTWLAFTYGWKPLISDVYDQLENLETILTRNEGELFTAVGRASATQERVRVIEDNDEAKVIKYITWKTRTRYKVTYGLADLSWRNVFGMNNPAQVAWEIVPFSFVVDWFLPIGSFIEGLTAYDGVVFKKGTRSQSNSYAANAVGQTTGKRIGSGSDYTITTQDGSNYGDCVSSGYYRTVLIEWPHQGFPEVFKNASSIAHATSALALLHQVFKGAAGSTRLVR